MADEALGGRPLPFKIPAGLDVIKARDARFWQAHAAWRVAVDDFEAWPGYPDQCDKSGELLQRSDVAFDAMMGTGVRTASALSMKYEALRESGCDLDRRIRDSFTIGDVLQWDVERLVKFELFGPTAFQDMAEG